MLYAGTSDHGNMNRFWIALEVFSVNEKGSTPTIVRRRKVAHDAFSTAERHESRAIRERRKEE
jgi:hypothetical protein